jgi:deoxyribodipyrimidine photolyase-related protein
MFLVFPGQFFSHEHLNGLEKVPFILFEDAGFFQKHHSHKQKIVLWIAAMRSYADFLRQRGIQVDYEKLNPDHPHVALSTRLEALLKKYPVKKISCFEIEDPELELALHDVCKKHKLKLEFRASPMFLTSRKVFENYLKGVETQKGRPMMRTFYQAQRKSLKVLVDSKGEPVGGRFSFENLNPMRLPREVRPPPPPSFSRSSHAHDAIEIVEKLFSNHPGSLESFFWPTTREQALSWLEHFLNHGLMRFGDYEDSLASHSDFIYHSALSSSLNLGLLTPSEILHQTLAAAQKLGVPIDSLEAFIRQLVGWREFARGMFQHFGDEFPSTNFWKHSRKLRACWYEGTTGLPVLDEAIKRALRTGYNHHSERLMILSNLMLLCEVAPEEAFRWFMSMHIDSAEWVTSPNVFGLGQYSDGGLVSTRPYICGAAYVRKMSHQAEGPWCDIFDGLYWSFVEKHQAVFAKNPRIAVALPALRKLDPQRKLKIFADAEKFRNSVTSL